MHGMKDNMENEIIPYIEMCRREGVSLQRGMNFGLAKNHSVILMSVSPGAPYADRFEDDGSTIVYEGHDVPRSLQNTDPKAIDQPELSPSGTPLRTGSSIVPPRNIRQARGLRKESESTKRLNRGFGHTMESFI